MFAPVKPESESRTAGVSLIRAGALQGYLQLLSDVEGEADLLLEQAGLSREILSDPEEFILFSAFEALLELSAKALELPDFGLRLARYQDLSMLGSIGLLMTQCETVLEAVRYARNYMSLHVHAEYWDVQLEGDVCFITRYQHGRQQTHKGQNVEMSLGVCFHLMRQLIGSDFSATAINFSHQPISIPSFYQRYFDAPVSFHQEKDQIVFSRKYLSRELGAVDPGLQEALREEMDRQMARHDGNIERQVRSLILDTMGSQASKLEYISDLLHMHPRTLQRRLDALNLSFKGIVHDIRMDAARWILANSQMPLTQLAQMLGYSELSAFSKAFKQQHKKSPRAWRRSAIEQGS